MATYLWVTLVLGLVGGVSVAVSVVGGRIVEAHLVWKLTHRRPLGTLYVVGDRGLVRWGSRPGWGYSPQGLVRGPVGLHPPRTGAVWETRLLVGEHELPAWTEKDHQHWDQVARETRRGFLERTRGHAERWRNVFAGAVALFGGALVVNKPTVDAEADADVLVLLVLVLALTLNAVAFAGWAAAGMPKMQVDLTPATAYVEELRQGAHSLVRLRVAVASGGLATALLVLVLARALGG